RSFGIFIGHGRAKRGRQYGASRLKPEPQVRSHHRTQCLCRRHRVSWPDDSTRWEKRASPAAEGATPVIAQAPNHRVCTTLERPEPSGAEGARGRAPALKLSGKRTEGPKRAARHATVAFSFSPDACHEPRITARSRTPRRLRFPPHRPQRG